MADDFSQARTMLEDALVADPDSGVDRVAAQRLHRRGARQAGDNHSGIHVLAKTPGRTEAPSHRIFRGAPTPRNTRAKD